jgi:hypothetical protein
MTKKGRETLEAYAQMMKSIFGTVDGSADKNETRTDLD